MTPLKTKRPLPSIPSTSARCPPEHPTTFPEWQIALQGAKLLYLKRQYKQCASRCTQLLDEAKPLLHPAHRTFLFFYCALSHELTARSLHNLSSTKLPFLELALEYYHSAACYLPTPEPTDDLSNIQDYPQEDEEDTSPDEDGEDTSPDEDEDTPQDTYSTASSTPSSPRTPISPRESLRRSSSSSLESVANENNDNDSTSNKMDAWSPYHSSIPLPSPLRIRKAVRFSPPTFLPRPSSSTFTLSPTPKRRPTNPSSSSSSSSAPSPTGNLPPTTTPTKTTTPNTQPPAPTPFLPHSQTAIALSTRLSTSPSLSSHTSLIFDSKTTSWLRSRSQQRYNAHLLALAPLLETHINTTTHLIRATTDAQRTRTVSSFSSSSGSSEEEDGSRKERIARLKERGWKRERFDARRYEDLCERALAEL
ncbi:MAG: hypothetical protein M1835_002037 [Candelina submexicana]|nr:MAG: hypothetical protein M1835_002037 [Candelina submexicana]